MRLASWRAVLLTGRVILLGSGETSASGRRAFEEVFRSYDHPPRVALLETPAGFELNSPHVIGRVAAFLSLHLQNFHPQIEIVSARKQGTPYSPNAEEIVAPLWQAEVIFMGPGSPTYAVRQLRDSLAWQVVLARHYLGADLVFASAAAIAISRFALPVYEIYKVGEDLHWKEGLDFFGLYGLPIVFIPHWNNREGGSELDTSRCFMGKERFVQLVRLLPQPCLVIGIDENTALFLDLGDCSKDGKSVVK
jgi:cyanophycinase-like exopeptidase